VMLFDRPNPDRLKSSETDVERDFRDFDSSVAQSGEDFRREVQAGGGRGNRASLARVYRLVALPISSPIGARNIRRQRNMAEPFDYAEKVNHGREPDSALPERAPAGHFRLQIARLTEVELLSHSNLAPGTHEALPLIRISTGLPREQDFDSPVQEVSRGGIVRANWVRPRTLAPAIEPGRKDASVVEHNQIIGPKQRRQVAEAAVCQRPCIAVEVQHPRSTPVGERFLRNPLFRKVEVEIRNKHWAEL
jgi:hypothetical protein